MCVGVMVMVSFATASFIAAVNVVVVVKKRLFLEAGGGAVAAKSPRGLERRGPSVMHGGQVAIEPRALSHRGLASFECNNWSNFTFARDLMQIECWHFLAIVKRW